MNKKENRMAVRQTVEKAVIRDEQNRRIQSAATNPVKEVLKILHTTLRGLEADTVSVNRLRLLEMRGMPVSLLIDLVHRNGGVLGPAHPCGEKYMSIANTKKFYQSPEIMKRFDFIEAYNCCESVASNTGAARLAAKYKKVTTGGSDSHKTGCVGRAYTILPEPVTCETELISMIHKKVPFEVGGVQYEKTTKDRIGKVNKVLVYSFWLYNKGGELIKRRGRKVKMEEEHPIDPIDPIELYYTGKS